MQMTVSGVSHYRGGTIEEIMPLAKALKASYLKHGASYQLSRVQDGPNAGDWLVVVTYVDASAFEKAQALFAHDSDMQRIFVEISKFAKGVSREMVINVSI
jgi:hypothetical protein